MPRANARPAKRAAIPVIADDPLAGKLVVRLNRAFDVIGCGHSKGFQLIKDGRLKVIKIDGMTLVYAASIRALLGLTDQSTAT